MPRTMSIQRRIGPAVALAVLAASLTVAAPAAAASTIVVAADGQAAVNDCAATTAAPTSIQAAVDAAAPGTTILVCPGSYTGLVSVGAGKDGIRIVATQPFAAKVRVPASSSADGLVTIDGADDVTIRGLSLLGGKSASCGSVKAGIVVRDAMDAVIRGNRIAPTASATRGPCSFAWGITVGVPPITPAADVLLPASALVAWNLVRDPRVGGIRVGGPDTSATVNRNSIRYWHEAAAPSRVGRRALHPAAGIGAAGIAILEGADAVIEGNAVSSGPDADPFAEVLTPVATTPVLPLGIAVGGSGTVRVARNVIARVDLGMSLQDNASLRVVENELDTVRLGINADDDGARYLRNTIDDTRYGIIARGGGQTFRDNALGGARTVDCLDETTGGGTLGTADTWSGNTGSVSYPIGICGSGAPDIMVTFTAAQPPTPAGGSPARFPTMVVGTFPGSPVSLVSNGFGGYEGTVALPLGGSYTYRYHDGLGPVEPCQPLRPLSVVNEGGLRMSVDDTLELLASVSSAAC